MARAIVDNLCITFHNYMIFLIFHEDVTIRLQGRSRLSAIDSRAIGGN